MKTLIRSLALSAVLSSILLATPESDVAQLRNEVNELKQMVQSLVKSNKELRSKQESYPKIGMSSNTSVELDKLKSSMNEIKSSLEGNEKSGFQLAGYASFNWADSEGKNSEFSGVQFSPIFHYQYADIFQFEGELEILTTKTGETEIGLEYAAGNLYLNNYMTLMVGKFMSPLGQFIQNQHPAWINKLPSLPVGFGEDGATPVSNVGIALRGGLPKVANMRSNYVVFVSNAPTFGLGEDGDVGVQAEGSTSTNDAAKTIGGRFAINPVGGMEVAISLASGEVAEVLNSGVNIARDYDVFGSDFMYKVDAFDFKAEYIQQEVGNNQSSALEGGTWKAWYTQASYQFVSFPLEPVIRYSDYHNPEQKRNQLTLGLNYLFSNNVIAKIAYEYNKDEDSSAINSIADNNRILAQLAFGF